MQCKYLTIEREYGSGGTKIAELLAEECSLPCYGRKILEIVAQNRNITVDQIEEYEESVTGSFLYTIFMMSTIRSGQSNKLSEKEQVYVEEQEVIHQLAEDGPAIFLGHCASNALHDKKGVVKVFIRAPKEQKLSTIREEYGIEENLVESTRKYFDRKRANYYHTNTGKEWKNVDNYDIVLDSSTLGIKGCVDVLKGLFLCNYSVPS